MISMSSVLSIQKSKLLSLNIKLKQNYQLICHPLFMYSLNLFDFSPQVTLRNQFIEQLEKQSFWKLYMAINQKSYEKQRPTFYFLFLPKQYLYAISPLHKVFKNRLNSLICLQIYYELHLINSNCLSGQLQVFSNLDFSLKIQLNPLFCFYFSQASCFQIIFDISLPLGKDCWLVCIQGSDYWDYSLISRHGSDA